MNIIKDNPIALTISTNIDLTGAQVAIGYEKPDDTTGSWSASIEGDPTNGLIKAELTTEIDVSGTWDIWSIATFGSDVYKGQAAKVVVLETPPDESYIVDVAKVKLLLGLDDTYDEKIRLLIPKVQQDYLNIRGARWDYNYDSSGNITGIKFPAGADVTAAMMIGWQMNQMSLDTIVPLESERIGSYSYNRGGAQGAAGNVGGYPKSITSSIKRYMKFGDEYVGEVWYAPFYYFTYSYILER